MSSFDPLELGGFTLLEMLLVVFVLSTLSFMAVQYTQTRDSKIRFDDTIDRLERIESAVVDFAGTPSEVLGGYSVDNGRLPEDLMALLRAPALASGYGAKAPLFDASPDTISGLNSGATVALDGPSERLMKGYRGAYLGTSQRAELNGERVPAYFDGWGNLGAPPNYGWVVQGGGDGLIVTSLGLDGSDNSPEVDGYDYDQSLEISENDWSVDIDGWLVTVRNRSGVDMNVNGLAGGCVRVSLLSFRQDLAGAPGSEWKRNTSGCISGPATSPSIGSCLDGNGDGLAAGLDCASEKQVFFDASAAFQPGTRIPAGEQILVLVVDDNEVAHDGSPGEQPCLGAGDCTVGDRNSRRLRFVPRYVLPDVVMDVGL